MKDKELREYLGYNNGGCWPVSNVTTKEDIRHIERRINDLDHHLELIAERINLLVDYMGCRFKYQKEYPKVELVEKEDRRFECEKEDYKEKNRQNKED